MLNAFGGCAFGDQRGLGGLDHLRPAAEQDLPVAPAAVARHDVGQHARLPHMQTAGRLDIWVFGGPWRIGVELRHRRHGQPRVGRRDLPQRAQVIELTGIAGAEEQKTKNYLLERFVNSMYNGSASSLVMQLLGNKKTSKKELKLIKDMLIKLDTGK